MSYTLINGVKQTAISLNKYEIQFQNNGNKTVKEGEVKDLFIYEKKYCFKNPLLFALFQKDAVGNHEQAEEKAEKKEANEGEEEAEVEKGTKANKGEDANESKNVNTEEAKDAKEVEKKKNIKNEKDNIIGNKYDIKNIDIKSENIVIKFKQFSYKLDNDVSFGFIDITTEIVISLHGSLFGQFTGNWSDSVKKYALVLLEQYYNDPNNKGDKDKIKSLCEKEVTTEGGNPIKGSKRSNQTRKKK